MRITDIARMAEVSVASVSRYFNGGYLSDEMREKIAAVIRETGYKPSSQAVRLRKQETKLIALIIPRINAQPVAEMLEGVSSVLTEQGYQMILANSGNDIKKELEYLRLFQTKNVDGVLFICGNVITPMHQKLFTQMELPFVLMGQDIEGFTCVYHADREAGRDIGYLFRQKGIKRPVCISVPESIKPLGYDRKNGFLEGYGSSAVSWEVPCLVSSRVTPQAGYEMTAQVFEQYPQTDAIFCVSDLLILGVYQYCSDHLIRIPEDVSVASVGGGVVTQALRPKLTYAGFYYYRAGVVAATQLMQMLQDKTTEVESVRLNFELVLHESIKNMIG